MVREEPPAQLHRLLQPLLVGVLKCEFFLFLLVSLGGEIDCVDVHGNTPLHLAARCGQELLISSLLSNGADKTK